MKRTLLGSFLLGLAAGTSHAADFGAPVAAGPAPVVSPSPAGCVPGSASCRWLELEADYLYWWVRDPRFNVPLLTTGVPGPTGGVVGAPGTQILVGGGENASISGQSGFRLAATLWFDEGLGFNASGFGLERVSSKSAFASDAAGNPLLAQPIVNADTGGQEALLISDPTAGATLVGSYNNSYTSSLFGYELNFVYSLGRGDSGLDVRALAGYRRIGLRETFTENVTIADPAGATGLLTFGGAAASGVSTTDTFRAETDFHGVQFGTRVAYVDGRFGLDLTTKLGLGVSQQRVHIHGVTADDQGNALDGGLRALPSNIGRRSSYDFAYAPEVGLNASYQLTDAVSARVGYNFLYLSRVVRATDQISPLASPGQIPSDVGFGAAGDQPQFSRQSSDFWVHGINAGLMIVF